MEPRTERQEREHEAGWFGMAERDAELVDDYGPMDH